MLSEESQTQSVSTNYSEKANVVTKKHLGLRDVLPRGKRELFRVMKMPYKLIVVTVSLVYAHVRTHQSVHFKWVHSAANL